MLGVQWCTPTVPALRSSQLKGGRQAHKQAMIGHRGDTGRGPCARQHGAKEGDLSLPRGGAEAMMCAEGSLKVVMPKQGL